MTMAIERPIGVNGEPCRARRHTGSNDSWNRGCRCAAAVAVHNDFLARHRDQREKAKAARLRGEGCTASTHGTLYAYEVNGCRCPASARRYFAVRSREAAARRRELERKRTWWRGPRTRVDRTVLDFALGGYPVSLTHGELLAAVAILSAAVVPTAAGPQPMTAGQIARRLGVDERQVWRIRAERRKRAEMRAQRRLLDRSR